MGLKKPVFTLDDKTITFKTHSNFIEESSKTLEDEIRKHNRYTKPARQTRVLASDG